MNLKEQKYVCVLADCGNITKAAEKLYISQPALSIYINNLEKTLGVRLFDRAGRKFILTFAGERYVEKARKMLELKREFDEELDEITDCKRGRIRIGIQIRRAPWLLPPVLARFQELYADIEVVVREGNMSELETMLDQYELDVILFNVGEKRPDMEYHLVYEEQMLIVVPEIHPLNERAEYVPGSKYRTLDLKYLEGESLILQHPNQSIRKDEDQMLSEAGVTPKKTMVIRSLETTSQLVAEGLGIGFTRAGYAAHMRYDKKVNYYTIGEKPHITQYVIGYKKGMHISPFTEKMMELLIEQGQKFC